MSDGADRAEADRLAALRRYEILDTPAEASFDGIAELARQMTGASVALVSLVDEHRQWFKAFKGVGFRQTPRHMSFCAHAIETDDVLVVPDASLDPRFADNPLVTGPPGIRFYAGAPITTPDGHRLGTVCIIDPAPRNVQPAQVEALRTLAGLAQDQLELRLAGNRLRREVKEREAIAGALREREAWLNAAVESLPFLFWIYDREGRYRIQNSMSRARWGDLIGRSVDGFQVPDAVRASWRATNARALAGETVRYESHDELGPNGAGDHEVILAPIHSDGAVIGLVGMNIDITERKRVERELREAERRLRALADSGVVGMVSGIGPDVLEANDEFLRIVGRSRASFEAEGLRWPDITPPEWLDVDRRATEGAKVTGIARTFEKEFLRPDGCRTPVLVTGVILDAAEARWLSLVQDITERKRAEAHVRHLAEHDPLTGLPNRARFVDRLNQALASARRLERKVALLCLDLNDFKAVNDSIGHPAGDALLREIAARLAGVVRSEDTVARLGGDEFAIVQQGADRLAAVMALVQRVLAEVQRPVEIEGQVVVPSTAIGVAVFPDDATDGEQLHRHADIALYRAKRQGRDVFQFFLPEMNEELAQRRRLEKDLRRALEHGGLSLHYQPQVRLADGRIVGVEALIRWQHPELGLIPPASFIPVAEDTGLITALGAWILREACRQGRAWYEGGMSGLRLGVNISPAQFHRTDIVDLTRETLEQTGFPARLLELEITERTLLRDADTTLQVMNELRDLGASLAVDDFGIGYSNLAYLRRLPLHRIKIDRSFVSDIPGDHDAAAITEAIVTLGHTLGLEVIAEGVETEAQHEFLGRLGCDEAQGYLFARPIAAEHVPALFAMPGIGRPRYTSMRA